MAETSALPSTFQQVLAALGVAVCLALLVHQFMGAQRQARLARWWQAASAAWQQRWASWQAAGRRRREAKVRGHAAREAAAVIERARHGTAGKVTRLDGLRRREGAAGGNGSSGTESGRANGQAAEDGSNVVRPPRFGGRRDDLH